MTLLCLFALAMSFASLWIRKTPWLWGSFLIIAMITAYQAHVISYLALFPIATLFLCQYALTFNVNKSTRFLLICTVTLLSLALAFHFLPGFYYLKPDGTSFDKPFIGIFVLALILPLIASRAAFYKMLRVTLPIALIGLVVLSAVALKLGVIHFAPRLPLSVFSWLGANFFLVTIPEEAFFRGFIQRESYLWFGKTPLAACGAICIGSIFFVLVHLAWVGSFPFLCLIFAASLLYGALYQWTGTIESSILCHFFFNVIHFLLLAPF
jgi:hypothetical protein